MGITLRRLAQLIFHGYRTAFVLMVGAVMLLLGLASCAPAATQIAPTKAQNAPTQAPTIAPQPTQAAITPAPALSPTSPAVPGMMPTSVAVATAVVEARVVELEWPSRLRLGDSDILRLSLIPSKDGYTVTTEFPEHNITSQNLPVKRPGGYELQAAARLDGTTFDIAPAGDQVQYLPVGEASEWRWSIRPRAAGQQRLSVSLRLRWIPEVGTGGTTRETTVFSRGLDIQVSSFFGLTRQQSMAGGLIGLIFGGGISLFALAALGLPGRSSPQGPLPNRALKIEPQPGLKLIPAEEELLRILFRRYDRLSLEGEFLSGYSGARTFLARPLRPDGRADAYTIVKIGGRESIQREYANYEAYVKNSLPPVTARIQQPPVTLGGHIARTVGLQAAGREAALQYTFIAQPGHSPASLRQALLAKPDPALLEKLFETFGPNWWMQRKPYSFRLSQEYDRMLPSHLVIEACPGKGRPLNGDSLPFNLELKVGDLVALGRFPFVEPLAVGNGYALRGNPREGQPALRVRWQGEHITEGSTGRVTATRETVLRGYVRGFDLFGLPDPLDRLPGLLNESVSSTQSTIHGDLNLENVLVGPGDFVWLIDFAQTREGPPLFDFAHLRADIVAHVLAERIDSAQDFLALLRGEPPLDQKPYAALLAASDVVAERCLFNPSEQSEYQLAIVAASLGALKYPNLERRARHWLYLCAAHICSLMAK